MNIDFRNRTIFFKILSGFMLLLALAALMGGVLFYSLRDVTGVLRRITERNAPSIRYPTGVERYALRTILDEKNYLLLQKKEIHEQAMHDIREIYANLDRVDQVAIRYNDQVLLRKSGDVRRAVEKYQGYYNQGVALLEENKSLEHKMRMLGRRVNDLSRTHTLDHKRLLEKAIANGIDQRKYMKGFHLCTEIENEALEARRQEKNYILYKNEEHIAGLREHIARLNRLYDEISKFTYVFEHQPLLAETRKATDQYLEAAEKWVANDKELSEILTRMHEIGVNMQQTALAVQEAGWQEMDTSKEAAVQTTEKASLTGILVAAVTLIMGIVLAFFIARGIAGPIKGLSLTTAGIAKGDLSKRVAVKGRDEAGQLAIAFNTMVENLQDTMVSRDYLDNIIKSMVDLLIVADAEGKIEAVNPATCDVSGYTEEELIGQPVNIIFAEEEEEEEEAFFKGTGLSRLMREGEVRNMELTILSKSGERIPLVFNGSVIRGEDGTLATVVGVARDMRETMRLIAELRESEEALQRFAQELEEKVEKRTRDLRQTQAQLIQAGKLAAIGQLAGGVAHEINNPLSGVLGFSINLLKAANNEELKKLEAFGDFPESLELIKESALRCKLITDKLLSFARESGHEFRPTDINRAIEDVLSLVGHQIKIRKVAVKKDLEARLPLPMADPNQLQQVFLNMILNAADAMPGGGELTIATGVREAETRSVEVTFTDTGEGISPENMDKLFEPFFTTKPPGKGTGLGLSLSYGIIKEHGGTIEVESEVGRGSRFTVILNIED